MNDTTSPLQQNTILPAGFQGLLPPDASAYRGMLTLITSWFERFGYQLVTPPALEFEESLFSWAGTISSDNTFRIMDPVSQRMMAVRSDITTQISRIASTQLLQQERPLRLTYSGEVFRINQETPYGERQFTQAGIELIGDTSMHSDIEVLSIAISTLEKLGITDICVDFSIPQLMDIVLDLIDCTADDERLNIKQLILIKDIHKLRPFIKESATMDMLTLLLTDPTLSIEQLKSFAISEKYIHLVNYLEGVTTHLSQRFNAVHITLDPLGADATGYHQNISYSLFSKRIQGEIGRGGRYLITHEHDQEEAVGVTFYLNRIFKIYTPPLENKKIAVTFDTPWPVKHQLAQDGYQVIAALDSKETSKALAEKQDCRYIWHQEKIIDAKEQKTGI